jgi:hypothetical protein
MIPAHPAKFRNKVYRSGQVRPENVARRWRAETPNPVKCLANPGISRNARPQKKGKTNPGTAPDGAGSNAQINVGQDDTSG